MSVVTPVIKRWFGVVVGAGIVISGVPAVGAEATESPVVGSLTLGDTVLDLEERTGHISVTAQIARLGGIAGVGSAEVSLSYRHERAALGDVTGLGAG